MFLSRIISTYNCLIFWPKYVTAAEHAIKINLSYPYFLVYFDLDLIYFYCLTREIAFYADAKRSNYRNGVFCQQSEFVHQFISTLAENPDLKICFKHLIAHHWTLPQKLLSSKWPKTIF